MRPSAEHAPQDAGDDAIGNARRGSPLALDSVSTGMFYDIAVRDLAMALATFVLAPLSELRYDPRPAEGQRWRAIGSSRTGATAS